MSTFNETTFSTMTGHGLNYAVSPNRGPAMVLFHGVLRCWRDFSVLLGELSLRHHLFVIDFRGHGDSSRDIEANYRVIDYVQDAAELVREIVPKPAILFGHSLGAMVAAGVAARIPESVSGLILEDPPFDTMGTRIHQTPFGSYFRHVQQILLERPNDSVRERAAALAAIPLEDQPGKRLGDVRDAVSLRFSAACLRRVDPRVLEPIVAAQWLSGYELDTVARSITAPTLLMQADEACGGMLTTNDANRLTREIDDCMLVRFPGTGHLIHWTEREATLQQVIGFTEAIR